MRTVIDNANHLESSWQWLGEVAIVFTTAEIKERKGTCRVSCLDFTTDIKQKFKDPKAAG